MCVIVHKERGIEVPNSEVLKKCFTRNPDGSGILLHRKGTKTCEIHKGFMKFDDFEKALKDLNVTKDDDLVMHFRITTSGGTNPENCHPFPISREVSDLKAVRMNAARAFVHNGVLGTGDEKIKISDTQVFVKDVMSRDEISNHLENEEVQKIIEELAGTGNKFFVADAEKDIFQRFGNWTEDKDCGCWFSNSYWKNSYSYSTGKSWSGYSSGKKGNTCNRYNYDDYYDYDYRYNYNKPAPPDVNTILCPYCDKKMDKLLEGTDYFICPDCGCLYDDKTFSIYDKKHSRWESIIDINNLENWD